MDFSERSEEGGCLRSVVLASEGVLCAEAVRGLLLSPVGSAVGAGLSLRGVSPAARLLWAAVSEEGRRLSSVPPGRVLRVGVSRSSVVLLREGSPEAL